MEEDNINHINEETLTQAGFSNNYNKMSYDALDPFSVLEQTNPIEQEKLVNFSSLVSELKNEEVDIKDIIIDDKVKDEDIKVDDEEIEGILSDLESEDEMPSSKKSKKEDLETQPIIDRVDKDLVTTVDWSNCTLLTKSKEYLLVGFQTGQKLSFIGGCMIIPIIGSVTVNGFNIQSNIKSIPDLDCSPIISTFQKAYKEISHPFDLDNLELRQYPLYNSKTQSIIPIVSIPTINNETSRSKEKEELNQNDLMELKSMYPLKPTQTEFKINLINELVEYPKLKKGIKFTIQDMTYKLFSKAKTQYNNFDSLILISSLSYTEFDKLDKPFDNFRNMFKLENVEGGGVKGCWPILEPVNNLSVLHLPSSWQHGSEIFSDATNEYVSFQTDDAPIAVVVGNKDHGKSTFVRYLINSLLNRFGYVGLINADPGQTELTPPGILALHVVSEPILGPSFTQHRTPLLAHYLGDPHTKASPEHYQQSLLALVDHFNTIHHVGDSTSENKVQFGRMPLIINCNGWVKGQGLDQLNELIDMSKPNFIFQMDKFNLKIDLNLNILKDNEEDELINKPKLILLSNDKLLQSDINLYQTKFSAQHHRNLSLISYLLRSKHLTYKWQVNDGVIGQKAYAVRWDHLELWCMDGSISRSQALYAFNGTLVGLYTHRTSQPKKTSPKEELTHPLPPNLVTHPSAIYPPPKHYNCIGLGIIRCIDPTTSTFYISTSLTQTQIQSITAIAKGGLTLPIETYIENDRFRRVRGTNHFHKINPVPKELECPYLSFHEANRIGSVSLATKGTRVARRSQHGDKK